MSLFETISTPCPACKSAVTYEMVHSVNADRRPDLRDAILDNSFQVLTCRACGENFRVEPQFSYIHAGGKLYLSVWPISTVGDWQAMEKRGDDSYAQFYGSGTSEAAQQIGAELTRRTVFGWAALREKLVAAQAGLDDVTLELAKVAVTRWVDGMQDLADKEFRLLGLDGDGQMVFGVLEPGAELVTEHVTVPADLLRELEADAAGWAALRARLAEGTYVDAIRLQLQTEPSPA